jgi:signal transduction histidine kinase
MKEGRRLLVQVQANGRGIPQLKQRELMDSGRGGVRFGGIRERLRQLGGTLEITSNGRGTLVSATLEAIKDLKQSKIKIKDQDQR